MAGSESRNLAFWGDFLCSEIDPLSQAISGRQRLATNNTCDLRHVDRNSLRMDGRADVALALPPASPAPAVEFV